MSKNEAARLAAALPQALRAPFVNAWMRLAEVGGEPARLPRAVSEQLVRVWACSRFVADACIAAPDLLHDLVESGRLEAPGRLDERVRAGLAGTEDEAELMARLRRLRREEMVRIAWRDLAGLADLGQTLAELSELARACIDGALGHLARWHRERFGDVPDSTGKPQQLVVLGFGKLGAGELNFSSDIDLVFAYAEPGTSDGPRALDSDDYFTRLGQRLIRVLDEVSPEGFVFRVDMRLRPFGESGPLVMHFGAIETYYQSHGREWERYALVKTSPVAGDIEAGQRLLGALRPFVYRRYLDFGVFESLREMKAMITQEVARRGLEENIKLGRGGIREIEFVAQAFQLIRGGREPALQRRELMPVLGLLADAGHLQPLEVEQLESAYRFLRRMENRLQEYADAQTHDLPDDELGQARLALAMDAPDWTTLARELEAHRARVRRIFDAIFIDAMSQAAPAGESADLLAVWQAIVPDEAARELLASAGFADVSEALELMRQLRESRAVRELSARGRRRLDHLVPRLLAAAADTAAPETTLARLTRVVEAIAQRTTYLSLLIENPRALEHLARVVSFSPWLSDLVAGAPLLLDELIDPRIFQHAPELEVLEEELDELLEAAPHGDLEARMNALRQFQQASVMRVAVADLSGVMGVMQVSDRLSDIAELVIAKALDIALAQLQERHGTPWCNDAGQARPARFIVVAYGKLGSLELGYGSDLDLVFVHDSTGERAQTHGAKPLENGVFFARLAQRVISILSLPTSAGKLYEVDTRLRPSGSAGLLVTTLTAFARYQAENAWTWEHQALLRARPVAGDPVLAAAFLQVRDRVLARPREAETLRREVAEMRVRMRQEHARGNGEGFDIKHDPGGLTDIEFLVQYWALRWAVRHPRLRRWTDNMRLLEGMMAEGLLPIAEGAALGEAFKAYRAVIHRLTLEGKPAIVPDAELAERRQAVQMIWRMVFPEPEPPADPGADG